MVTALDRLRDRKKATTKDIPICMDSGLVASKEQLTGKLGQLKAKLKIRSDEQLEAQISELEDELEEVRVEILRASEWIRLTALAPDEYQDLLDTHKPTKEQIREARKLHGPRASLQWNTDTFPDAILVECASVLTVKEFNPETDRPVFQGDGEKFTDEFVKEMRKEGLWNSAEVSTLVNAAMQVNESMSNIDAAGNG